MIIWLEARDNLVMTTDMDIMVYPNILDARNYLSTKKLFGKTPMVCKIKML